MKELVYIEALLFFILGLAFSQWVGVLFDSLVKLLCTLLEANSANASLRIAEANKKIQEYQLDSTDNQAHVIGFSLPEETEEEYYDE